MTDDRRARAQPAPRVDAVGTGCLLVHRRVYQKMIDHYATWYEPVLITDRNHSEDFTFCRKAKELGYPIFVDTTVQLSHRKPILLTPRVG